MKARLFLLISNIFFPINKLTMHLRGWDQLYLLIPRFLRVFTKSPNKTLHYIAPDNFPHMTNNTRQYSTALPQNQQNFYLYINANSSKRRKAQFPQLILPQFTTQWWSAQEQLAFSICTLSYPLNFPSSRYNDSFSFLLCFEDSTDWLLTFTLALHKWQPPTWTASFEHLIPALTGEKMIKPQDRGWDPCCPKSMCMQHSV